MKGLWSDPAGGILCIYMKPFCIHGAEKMSVLSSTNYESISKAPEDHKS
jgi:hypothetical protein